MLLHTNTRLVLLILIATCLTFLIGRTPSQGDPILSCATVDSFLETRIIPDSSTIKNQGIKFPAVYAAQCVVPLTLSRLLNNLTPKVPWFILVLPIFSIFLTFVMTVGLNRLLGELEQNPTALPKQFPLIGLLIISTPFLVYSRTLASEILQSCLLVWGYYFWLRLSKSNCRSASLRSLIALVSILFLIVNLKVIYYYLFALLFLALAKKKNTFSIKKTTVFATAAITLTLSFLTTTLYNYLRFGSPFESGYTQGKDALIGFSHPFLTGFFGQILSPGKGLIWYAPCLFLLIPTIPKFWRANKKVSIELSALIIPLILIHSKWWAWEGGWSWGPRFLLPALPLLFLPVFYLDLKQLWIRTALTITTVLGACINLPAILINYFDYYEISAQIFQKLSKTSTVMATNDHVFLHFIPEFSPISAQWWLLKCKLSGAELCSAPPWDYYKLSALADLVTAAPQWDLLIAATSNNVLITIALTCFFLTLTLLLYLVCRSSHAE
jgi:hypothetical protein